MTPLPFRRDNRFHVAEYWCLEQVLSVAEYWCLEQIINVAEYWCLEQVIRGSSIETSSTQRHVCSSTNARLA